jgi:amino acid transporter
VNLPVIVLVVLCCLLLVRGASESAWVNAIMVAIKIGVLLLFVVIGLTAFQADRFDNFWAGGSAGVTAGLHGITWVIFGSWLVLLLAYYFIIGRHRSRITSKDKVTTR